MRRWRTIALGIALALAGMGVAANEADKEKAALDNPGYWLQAAFKEALKVPKQKEGRKANRNYRQENLIAQILWSQVRFGDAAEAVKLAQCHDPKKTLSQIAFGQAYLGDAREALETVKLI
jgi:hypothetical protein